MEHSLAATWQAMVGASANDITWGQMSLRALLVFSYAILLFRIAPSRSFGKSTTLDVVLAVILGSMLSRALTGNAPLLPTFLASGALVLLHIAVARLAFHAPRFGHAVKGLEIRLVRDGEIDWAAMKRTSITTHDLREALRLKAGIDDVSEVAAAFLERSGEISVIRRKA